MTQPHPKTRSPCMTQTPLFHRILNNITLLLLLIHSGCHQPPDLRDQRLVEIARESMSAQRQQNDRIADQSAAVIQESHQLAEAAKELVELDAEARRELVAAQRELQTQTNQQRSSIDSGRDQLEQERRQLAAQRQRDPLIAAVIQQIGLIIACLLPLIICYGVIRQLQSTDPDHAAVAELLMFELTSDQPLLLPGPVTRSVATAHQEVARRHAAFPAQEPDTDQDPPF